MSSEKQSKHTMRGVVFEGKPYHMAVKDLPIPKLQAEEDVIVRVTTAAICGSDLHNYHGILGSSKVPWVMGHEAMGIVTEVGPSVTTIKVGDRVIIPCIPDDGYLNVKPAQFSDFPIFGEGVDFGNLGGSQAEYVRVPQGDHSCIPIPKDGPADKEYLFISDIWATAWIGLDASGFQPGDTVAVFGVGPVGLLCVYSAFLRGASKVYAIDHVPQRLEKAASMGAVPIDFTKGAPSVQIMKKEPLGVIRSVDCCGYECLNEKLELQENYILTEAINVTTFQGGIGVMGIYISVPKSEGAPRADTVSANLTLPYTTFWGKCLSMKAALGDSKPLAQMLVSLVNNGKAKTGLIVSNVIGIEEAPKAYQRFDNKLETKVLIRFPWKHGIKSEEGDGEEY